MRIGAYSLNKCKTVNMRNWQHIKCEIKMRKLISVANQPPTADVVYNVSENVKPLHCFQSAYLTT